MTKLPGSSPTVVFILRMKMFTKTILKHYLQTMFTKTDRILITGLTLSLTDCTTGRAFKTLETEIQMLYNQSIAWYSSHASTGVYGYSCNLGVDLRGF